MSLKSWPGRVEDKSDGVESSVGVSARPPRRPDWNGIAIYASVQGVLFGALAIGYGAISHERGEQVGGLLLVVTGLVCAWYSRLRRAEGAPGPLRRPSFRLGRPRRRPLAIATTPGIEAASILAVWGCIFAVAIVEMRG